MLLIGLKSTVAYRCKADSVRLADLPEDFDFLNLYFLNTVGLFPRRKQNRDGFSDLLTE